MCNSRANDVKGVKRRRGPTMDDGRSSTLAYPILYAFICTYEANIECRNHISRIHISDIHISHSCWNIFIHHTFVGAYWC